MKRTLSNSVNFEIKKRTKQTMSVIVPTIIKKSELYCQLFNDSDSDEVIIISKNHSYIAQIVDNYQNKSMYQLKKETIVDMVEVITFWGLKVNCMSYMYRYMSDLYYDGHFTYDNMMKVAKYFQNTISRFFGDGKFDFECFYHAFLKRHINCTEHEDYYYKQYFFKSNDPLHRHLTDKLLVLLQLISIDKTGNTTCEFIQLCSFIREINNGMLLMQQLPNFASLDTINVFYKKASKVITFEHANKFYWFEKRKILKNINFNCIELIKHFPKFEIKEYLDNLVQTQCILRSLGPTLCIHLKEAELINIENIFNEKNITLNFDYNIHNIPKLLSNGAKLTFSIINDICNYYAPVTTKWDYGLKLIVEWLENYPESGSLLTPEYIQGITLIAKINNYDSDY